MKILAFGKDNKELPTMEISCTGKGFNKKGCGALLEITPLDVQSGIVPRFGETENFLYIICPVCQKKTELYRSRIQNENFRQML